MSWVSPTGHTDTDGNWYDETKGYDENTGTLAYNIYTAGSGFWGGYIELTIAAITSNKLRYYISSSSADVTTVDVDVYDGSWHNVYQGSFSAGWQERSYPAQYSNVTKARIRFYYNTSYIYGYVYELEFWEITGVAIPVAMNQYATHINKKVKGG
jgi:hypothetical protein